MANSNTTIWGYVGADGTVNSGSGFSVSHDSVNGKGTYYITFDQKFDDVPAVNVTIQCDDYRSGWWINAFVLDLTDAKCEIICVEGDLRTLIDSNFSFTAVGPGE